ncbi:MAG TPA: RNA polymerase sigma factor [Candidatus Dormibacteraeota bacterium]
MDLGYRLAVSMLGGPNDAEDAVQEATIKAWQNIGRLRDETALRSWFLSIVANQCRSIRRGRCWKVVRMADLSGGGGPPVPPVPPVQAQPGPETAAAAQIDLRRALAGLGSGDRTALYLRYGLDLPLAEVAAVLGITETATRSRIKRASERLRPVLEMTG